jgi:hypothetical protein
MPSSAVIGNGMGTEGDVWNCTVLFLKFQIHYWLRYKRKRLETRGHFELMYTKKNYSSLS